MRNDLEEACHQLVVNFMRVNDIMNAKYMIGKQSMGTQLWELCYKDEQRVEYALNGLLTANRERSKRKSFKVQSDTGEAMSVAALVLWYTAVEEYCFSLLKIVADTRPELLSSKKKFSAPHVTRSSTIHYKLKETFLFLLQNFTSETEIEFKPQSCKDLIDRFNSDRNDVVHHGKSYDSDFDLPDYTWQIHKICFEIAQCLAKRLLLQMRVNRLLIE